MDNARLRTTRQVVGNASVETSIGYPSSLSPPDLRHPLARETRDKSSSFQLRTTPQVGLVPFSDFPLFGREKQVILFLIAYERRIAEFWVQLASLLLHIGGWWGPASPDPWQLGKLGAEVGGSPVIQVYPVTTGSLVPPIADPVIGVSEAHTYQRCSHRRSVCAYRYDFYSPILRSLEQCSPGRHIGRRKPLSADVSQPTTCGSAGKDLLGKRSSAVVSVADALRCSVYIPGARRGWWR